MSIAESQKKSLCAANTLARTLIALAAVLIMLVSSPLLVQDSFALTVGDTEIEGYQPDDIISSDYNMEDMNVKEGVKTLDQAIVKLVIAGLPYLMLACVVMIIYRAVTNIFKKPEERYPIGDLLKNIFAGFFWILFAWIAVEIIVLVITNGEGLLVKTVFG